MPLSLTEFNHFYIINKVCGLEKQRHYLESLGFVPGTQVTILSELRVLCGYGKGQQNRPG
ncbi:MAG: FeoA family protein [Blautia faecis]